MKPSTFDILCIFWVCIIVFIVYKRTPSHTVIILGGLVITFVTLKQTQIESDIDIDIEDLEWLDTMLHTKDVEEKKKMSPHIDGKTKAV